MEHAAAKRTLLFAIILNLLLGGAYGLLFYLLQKENNEALAISQSIESKKTVEDEAIALRHIVNTTKEDREKLESYFVRSEQIDAFIESLKAIGAEADAAVILQSLTETKDQSLLIELRVTGTFNNIFYLTKLIEHLPYRLEFKKAYWSVLGSPAGAATDAGKGKTSPERRSHWEANFVIELFGFIKE